jgi:hypothetical protein
VVVLFWRLFAPTTPVLTSTVVSKYIVIRRGLSALFGARRGLAPALPGSGETPSTHNGLRAGRSAGAPAGRVRRARDASFNATAGLANPFSVAVGPQMRMVSDGAGVDPFEARLLPSWPACTALGSDGYPVAAGRSPVGLHLLPPSARRWVADLFIPMWTVLFKGVSMSCLDTMVGQGMGAARGGVGPLGEACDDGRGGRSGPRGAAPPEDEVAVTGAGKVQVFQHTTLESSGSPAEHSSAFPPSRCSVADERSPVCQGSGRGLGDRGGKGPPGGGSGSRSPPPGRRPPPKPRVDPEALEINRLIKEHGEDAEALLELVAERGPAFNAVNCATCLNRWVVRRDPSRGKPCG